MAEIRQHQVPPREISKREKFNKHGTAAQSADDGIHVAARAVKVEHPAAEIFEIADLRFEFFLWVLADARTSGEHDRGRQRGDALQRGDDLPNVVACAQGAVPAADEEIAGEEPAARRFVETDVVATVTGRVQNLEAVTFRLDPRLIRERARVTRFGPAPNDFAIRVQGLRVTRVGENRQGEGMGEDFQRRMLALQLSVRADVVFVGVGVDDVRQRNGTQSIGQFGRGEGTAAVDEQAA